MMDMVMAIAIPLAKTYGMNKAIDIAYERLGIEPPDTEMDIFTGGGINQAFSPNNLANIAKRGAVNLGIRSLANKGIGALGALGPLGIIGGIALLGNKYRKQLTGYDTQAAYEAARAARKADNRLNYITNRILSGKNYGNYEDALLDSTAGAVKIGNNVMYATDYFPDPTPKSPKTSKTTFSRPDMRDIAGNGSTTSSKDEGIGVGDMARGGIVSYNGKHKKFN